MALIFLLLKLVIVVSFVNSLDLRVDPLVLIDQGLVRGLRASDGDYSAFYGIPYAQVDYTNPFGDALPAPLFDNVFNANNGQTACPQTLSTRTLQLNEDESLDCLKLNIFVPNSANTQNPLPVLFWIHGGGFEVGKGLTENALSIVQNEIIFITINYRLGPYGFMCLDDPAVPGNQGLKDQYRALLWVRDNIAAFGGNPNNITIGGNEAGGASVNYHLYSENEKIFNKAVIQSFTAQTTGAFTQGDVTVARRLAEHLGYSTNSTADALTFLATTSPALVTAATIELSVYLRPCQELSFSGIQNFIASDPISISNGDKIRNTPILIGITSNEFQGRPFNDEVYSTNSFSDVLGRNFNLDENDLFDAAFIVSHFYLSDDPIGTAPSNVIETFQSDYFFSHALEREVTKLVNTQSAGPVFTYVFNYLSEQQREFLSGAPHGSEMAYIFSANNDDFNEEDGIIAANVNTFWTNFIKFGNPTPEPSSLVWQPVSGEDRPYLLIDSNMRMENRFRKESMAFWDLFYAAYGRFNRLLRNCY